MYLNSLSSPLFKFFSVFSLLQRPVEGCDSVVSFLQRSVVIFLRRFHWHCAASTSPLQVSRLNFLFQACLGEHGPLGDA